MNYVIGVDGGGTGCRAAIADESGAILAQARSGAANIRTDLDSAYRHIMTAVREAQAAAGLDPSVLGEAHAVLGLAGGNVGSYARQLEALLPFRRSTIVNDGVIALNGALGRHDGVLAIVGTGSVFTARREGKFTSIGGWGFQVGDLGSGARLGRQLLEEVLLAHDGVRPSSPIVARVLAAFDDDPRKLVERVREATPGFYASHAPLIVEAADRGDAIAQELVAAACHDVERMLDVILDFDKDRLCLLGGLAPAYARRLGPRYRAVLKPALGDAIDGAVQMAIAHLAEATGRDSAVPRP